jgi:hypothetical protein
MDENNLYSRTSRPTVKNSNGAITNERQNIQLEKYITVQDNGLPSKIAPTTRGQGLRDITNNNFRDPFFVPSHVTASSGQTIDLMRRAQPSLSAPSKLSQQISHR